MPDPFVTRLFGRTRKLSIKKVAGPGPPNVVETGVVTVYVVLAGPPVSKNSPLVGGSMTNVFAFALKLPLFRMFNETLSVILSIAIVPKLSA